MIANFGNSTLLARVKFPKLAIMATGHTDTSHGTAVGSTPTEHGSRRTKVDHPNIVAERHE